MDYTVKNISELVIRVEEWIGKQPSPYYLGEKKLVLHNSNIAFQKRNLNFIPLFYAGIIALIEEIVS